MFSSCSSPQSSLLLTIMSFISWYWAGAISGETPGELSLAGGVGGWWQNNLRTWEKIYVHKFAIIPIRLWPTDSSLYHWAKLQATGTDPSCLIFLHSNQTMKRRVNMWTELVLQLQRIAPGVFVSEYTRQNIINMFEYSF